MRQFKQLATIDKIAIITAVVCAIALMYISYKLDGTVLPPNCGVDIQC